jgi:excisionase family DNA binding protein
MKTDVISTNEAAEILGVTPRRVLALIESGKLPALKLGRFYALRREDLAQVTTYGKPGRPPAKKAAKKKGAGK